MGATVVVNLILPPVYADNTAISDKYTVGPGYIVGVEENCTAEDFLNGLNAEGAYVETAAGEERTDVIQTGDILKVDGEEYEIHTQAFKREYIINDDFSDGTGDWTRTAGDVSKFAVEENDEHGNVLAFNGTGTVKASRSVEISGNPEFIVEEMNVCFPEFNSEQVGIIAKNASDSKYLSVIRYTNGKDGWGIYSLDPGGYYTLKSNVQANKWYNIKHVTRTEDGIIYTYIDGVCVAENKRTQAVVNSPGDYIPVKVDINVDNMNTESAGLQLADYKMYTAETIGVEKIEYVSGENTSLDLRSVPTDMPQINMYFTADTAKIDAESVENGVLITDEDDNEISCKTEYNALTQCCTITPETLLKSDSIYKIKAENITDKVSGFKFNGEYKFETNSENIPFILASAQAKCGDDVYDDISTVRKDTDAITLKFICRDDTEINPENIDEYFGFTDKDGNSVNYEGAYNASEHTYTFNLKSELVSGKEYKISVNALCDTVYNKEYSKEINIKAVGSTLVDTEIYTVTDGAVLGVKEGISKEEFLSGIICLGEPVIYEGDTENARADKIHNGDTLSVSGKKYKIETNIYPNDDIFLDTFNDGDSGSWSKNAMMSVVTDKELGKVLSWTGDGATDAAKKSFTSTRSISIGTLPSTLIFEFDMKFPVFNSTQIGLIMKNSEGKYLVAVRMFPEGGEYKFKTLYTGGYKELLSGVKEDKNYRFKFEMDTSTGLCDIYIDGKLIAEQIEMQAVKNSPGNYTPTSIEISGQNINADGITLMMDNIELYSPTTVRTSAITVSTGDKQSGVLESIPVDFDSIKIKLSSESPLEKDTGSIAFEDKNGNTVDCEISENTDDMSYTLRPKCILENNSEYSIVISNMADSAYKIPYSRTYKITTNAKTASAKIYSMTARSGGKEYDEVSKIRTDTEEISMKFIFRDGISVNAENVMNAVGLYDGEYKIETENTYDETTCVFTMKLPSQLTSGNTYKLKINDLKDNDGNVVLSRSVSMRAAAAWMVESGDIVQSDSYTVSSGEISGVKYGTKAAEIYNNLNLLPGTSVTIYENADMQTENTGMLSEGNVIEVYNSFTGETKIYKLSFGNVKAESNAYNITDNLIFGVESGTSTEEFISKLNIMGADSYEVTDADGNPVSEITNGTILKLTGNSQTVTYDIATPDTDDTVYFMSDFEDGSLNGWSAGTIEKDGDHGNVLSGVISGATVDAKKNFSAKKELNITDTPEILVFETDVKIPVLPKSTIGILMRNSKDKYLSVFRIDQKETFYTLIPNAQSTISENMQANKWYHVTYVNNCELGTTDIYLDGKLAAEGLKFQATENYIPTKLEMSVDSTTSNGSVLSIDNMTLYAPNPIKTAYVETVRKGGTDRDLSQVPIDIDEINVGLSVRNGYTVKNDAAQCITIEDKDGNAVSATNTYDSSAKTVKIIPNEILDSNSEYTIKISGIIDDVYSKSFNDEIKFTTSGYDIDITNMFIMNESGEMQNGFSSEKLTVYAPVINYGDKKTITFMLALYDKNGRLITCVSKDDECEKASFGETVFNVNLSGNTTKAASAKIYAREKNGGPLAKPFSMNIADK